MNLIKLISWVGPFTNTFISIVIFYSLHLIIKKNISKDRRNKKHAIVGKQMFHLLIWLIFLVVATLSLPIHESTKGQLLSFMGILITAAIALSSTTFVGNAMAGFMLKANQDLVPGSFVSINDVEGRVTELGLFHCELQIENSDLVTLSNMYMVQNPFQIANDEGTFVYAEVSLGYDTPMSKIKASLIRALENTGLENCFVSVRDLGDYSVTYRASGQLFEVKNLVSKRSKLKESIFHELHLDSIEITSPSFMNQRVFNHTHKFIPKNKAVTRKLVEETPVDVIFDKAEEAQGIDKMRERLNFLFDSKKKVDDQDELAKIDKEINKIKDFLKNDKGE
ncbi:mechanosensitive ion channel [Bacteriovoracaceae bacterium]|nr:mechanosensitive ion channel [Bacteriovoracaceae bacterium]